MIEEVPMAEDQVFHYTVRMLIEALSSFPPGTPILASGYKNGFENIQPPVLEILVHKPYNPYYDGEFQPAEERDKGIFRSVILRRVTREN